MAKKKVSKRSQPRSKSAKESIGKSLRKPTLSYEVGRHANEFVYWGICTLVAPPSLVPEIRQRALDRLVEAWLPAVATDADRIHVNRWVLEAQERFSKLLTFAQSERWELLVSRIAGKMPEIDDDSDAVADWINPFAGEIARIETELFEHIQRSVNSRHVPIVRLGVLLDRLHRPTRPELVALRVVNAQLCGFRPITPGSLWRETVASQPLLEDLTSENDAPSSSEGNAGATVEAAMADATLSNSPILVVDTTGEAIEYLSGDKSLLDATTSQPRPPFSISAGGLSNEAAYIRDQYAGVQHALSEIAGSIMGDEKTIQPSDQFIRKATAIELLNFISIWVSSLNESSETLRGIVAEVESRNPQYGFLDTWVVPNLRIAGRKGFAETIKINSSGAARFLELMVGDLRGSVTSELAIEVLSPKTGSQDNVYTAKSVLMKSLSPLGLRVRSEYGKGYALEES
ncbi:MAG: hypothetical protein NTZ32_18640 [Planctomycetales bacterium]|nr:hypothetical protein [Planctomycetales bacterium]